MKIEEKKIAHSSSFFYEEAATGSVLYKKVFLKISKNSQENTCLIFNKAPILRSL